MDDDNKKKQGSDTMDKPEEREEDREKSKESDGDSD
jgi:hypothetical protein